MARGVPTRARAGPRPARRRSQATGCSPSNLPTSAQLIEQRLRVDEVAGLEALDEPPVDRRQEVSSWSSKSTPRYFRNSRTAALSRRGRPSSENRPKLSSKYSRTPPHHPPPTRPITASPPPPT